MYKAKFSFTDLSQKPYNRCLNCIHINSGRCDGPNFLAMSLERFCEWCRDRKELLGWTNAELADKAGLAKGTVDRILSGKKDDLKVSTMQLLAKALVNGSWGEHPCANPDSEYHEADWQALQNELDAREQEIARLRERLNAIRADAAREIQTIRDESQRKVDYLKADVEKKEKIIDRLLEK